MSSKAIKGIILMVLRYSVFDTLVGDVTLVGHDKGLTGLLFGSFDPIGAVNEETLPIYDGTMELNQYFYGQRKQFSVKLKVIPQSEKEKEVWLYCLAIPYGETRQYKEAAKALSISEDELHTILSRNPLPVFIPTHRLIGPSGGLIGYVGGCEIQEKLLLLESRVIAGTYQPGMLE